MCTRLNCQLTQPSRQRFDRCFCTFGCNQTLQGNLLADLAGQITRTTRPTRRPNLLVSKQDVNVGNRQCLQVAQTHFCFIRVASDLKPRLGNDVAEASDRLQNRLYENRRNATSDLCDHGRRLAQAGTDATANAPLVMLAPSAGWILFNSMICSVRSRGLTTPLSRDTIPC